VPFELESHLPFEHEDAVVDHQVLATHDGQALVLAALAPKAAVREHLDALAAAGIEPRVVDVAALGALNLLADGNGGRTAFVTLDHDRGMVALLEGGGRLAGVRTLSGGVEGPMAVDSAVREVRWSLLALAADQSLTPLTLRVGGDAASTPGLLPALGDALGATPHMLDSSERSEVPDALRHEQAAFATTLGLALRDGAGRAGYGVNFRRGEFAYHREREALWRGVRTAAVLAAIALVVMVASAVLEGWRLEARRDALRADVRALFLGAMPDARTIVNEKAQLEAEIAALEKERLLYGGLAPSAPRAIDLLRALTAAVPAGVALDVDELALDGETLRLRGSTRSYEDVEAVKQRLAALPQFRDVQAKDVRASVDGGQVEFRLALTLARGEPS
jgi:Tfp pilus assembly protein PilN